MANLTFTDIQNEVYDHTGLDSTDANNQTRVKRWINFVQQDICARWPWTFMESSEQVATIQDYTTGTVSINSGSNSVTGTGTVFTSIMGTSGQYYIQFKGTNDWYKITAQSSGTAITIDQNYQPSTNASLVTYIIRKFYYSLSSSADRIINLVNWNTPVKMVQVDLKTMTELNPIAQSTNTSYAYVPWGYDGSNNIQFIPYPFPSDNRIIQVKTTKRPTDMSAGTDSPAVPNKYAHVISFGAIAVGFGYLRKMDLAQAWDAKFEQRLAQMKSEYKLSEDYEPWLRSIDSIQRSKWIQFPGQWPTLVGS